MSGLVAELVVEVFDLSRSNAIWWELVNAENRSQYQPIFEKYPDFFSGTIGAHLHNVIVTTYWLFEKRRDTFSISRLLGELESVHRSLVADLRTKIDNKRDLLKSVFHLRGNVVAHRNAVVRPEGVFEQASLTAAQFGEVVSLAQEVMAVLADVTDMAESAEEQLDEFRRAASNAAEDIRAVISILRREPSNSSSSARESA